VLEGDSGDDGLDSADGTHGNDKLDGGSGADHCKGDFYPGPSPHGDPRMSCETLTPVP
jgi:hypothetical protein